MVKSEYVRPFLNSSQSQETKSSFNLTLLTYFNPNRTVMTRAVKEVAVWAGLSVTSSATACWTPAVWWGWHSTRPRSLGRGCARPGLRLSPGRSRLQTAPVSPSVWLPMAVRTRPVGWGIYGSLQTPDGVHRHLRMTTGGVRWQLKGHCRHYIDNFRSLITQSRININIDWVLNLHLKWSQIEYSIYDIVETWEFLFKTFIFAK